MSLQSKISENKPTEPVQEREGSGSRPALTSGLALRLRRITTSGVWVPEIDGLRFVAIVSVVLFHIGVQTRLGTGQQSLRNPFWLAISNGYRGVPLFFAISGFILGLPFASYYLRWDKPVRLKSYFLRRLTRLEPPYMVAMLLRAAILIFAVHKPLREIVPSTIASLFYVHNLVFAHSSYINPPAWSLEVEIQFYCLAPFLAFLYFSFSNAMARRGMGVAAILVGCTVHDYFVALSPRLEMSLACNLQYFLAGFLLVDLYVADWKRIPRHFAWDLISLTCWPLIFLEREGRLHFYFPLIIVVAYVAAFKGPVFSRIFRLTWVALLGGMCYSLYLTHNLAISVAASGLSRLAHGRVLPGWETVAVTYGTCLPLVVVFGLMLYVLVERPCMDRNWPAKLWARLGGRRPTRLLVCRPATARPTAGPDAVSE